MNTFLPAKSQQRQRGSATMIVLAMLGIMLICVSVNMVALQSLDRDLKLLEKKQVQRLQKDTTHKTAAVNAPISALAAQTAPAP